MDCRGEAHDLLQKLGEGRAMEEAGCWDVTKPTKNNDNLLHDETMAIYCTTNTTHGSCVVCYSVEGLVCSSEGRVTHRSAMEADSKLEPQVHGL